MEEEVKSSVNQEEIHGLLFSRKLGWQEIVYDLINTEQLDPWDINITILTNGYLKKLSELEEADFFVSSKVLLAASLLLRIKSEILLNKYIKSIDEILFGKKQEKKYELERIELDEDIPQLIPRSPIPRFKRVTLKELISALNKAINTENRRIKKEIINKNALRETGISLPKRKFSIQSKIKELHSKLNEHFNKNPQTKKTTYTNFIGTDREERILCFYPMLQLENQEKIWLDQEEHFQEIDIWLKKDYIKFNGDPFADLKQEIENEIQELEEIEKIENLEDNEK